MKKHIYGLLAAVVLLAASCKKADSEPETPAPPPPVLISPVIGYWTGTYNTTGFIGSTKYALLVKSGGLLRVYDLDASTDTTAISPLAKADGVWTLNGTTFQATYKSGTKTVNTTALVNAAFSNMTGTWAFEGVTKGNVTLSK